MCGSTDTQGGLPVAPARLGFMAGGVLKVLILAGRLKWDDGGWPLPSLLDRLERRGVRLQVLCLSRGGDLTADPRAVEIPIAEEALAENLRGSPDLVRWPIGTPRPAPRGSRRNGRSRPGLVRDRPTAVRPDRGRVRYRGAGPETQPALVSSSGGDQP